MPMVWDHVSHYHVTRTIYSRIRLVVWVQLIKLCMYIYIHIYIYVYIYIWQIITVCWFLLITNMSGRNNLGVWVSAPVDFSRQPVLYPRNMFMICWCGVQPMMWNVFQVCSEYSRQINTWPTIHGSHPRVVFSNISFYRLRTGKA